MSEAPSPEFDTLLSYLNRARGFDFSAYKRPSLIRRVEKRMHAVGVERFIDYSDYLEVHPDEFALLFDDILINVTSFFRDDTTWDCVRDEIVASLAAAGGPIRIWSAGCASGEETYSIAMLLADALGVEGFRERVKIYATDADEQALSQARLAAYTEKQVQAVPEALRNRYFTRDGDRFIFDKDLRRVVIFGRHDLMQDAPISRANLVICRNTLMYFNSEAQARILARFHFALAPGGILFLGKAEMLLTQSQSFAPLDLRRRIFRKIEKTGWRERRALMNQASGDDSALPTNHLGLYSPAFDANPVAQIVLDVNGALALFNDRARSLFGLAPGDIGRPLQDLDVSYRPMDLRSLIDHAYEQHAPAVLKEVEWIVPGRETRFFEVHATPLAGLDGRNLGTSVTFGDLTRVHELEARLSRAKQDLDTAYEELQSTNEELETTNEELQSTVEELETTNEELQSTNEELETMNEELQSTNEELQTINDELRTRGTDFSRANALLESILTGVRSGVIVVDRELRVLNWNHRSEDLWGLRREEVQGQNILTLDIGLPVEQLRGAIKQCLGGDGHHARLRVRAMNRRGRAIECHVTCTPLMTDGRHVQGAIMMIDEHAAGEEPESVN